MRAVYSNTLVASPNLAAGRTGPTGLSFNGQPVIDEAQLFRAAYATLYGRGDGPVECGFTTWVQRPSEAALMLFMGTFRETLPVQADLVLTDDAETVSVRMVDAIREVTFGRVVGVTVQVNYRFRGARFTSEDVIELPEDSDTVKVKTVALTAGEVSKAVTFDSPFASVPRGVTAQLLLPTSSAQALGVYIDKSTITEGGFTVLFDAAVPASGYELSITAIL